MSNPDTGIAKIVWRDPTFAQRRTTSVKYVGNQNESVSTEMQDSNRQNNNNTNNTPEATSNFTHLWRASFDFGSLNPLSPHEIPPMSPSIFNYFDERRQSIAETGTDSYVLEMAYGLLPEPKTPSSDPIVLYHEEVLEQKRKEVVLATLLTDIDILSTVSRKHLQQTFEAV